MKIIDHSTTLLSVAQVAQSLGLHSDTIRRWEKKGLIKSHRDQHNYRVFSVEEVQRVHQQQLNQQIQHFEVLRASTQTHFRSIELFAGAGGLALGFENAGFEHSLLVEIDKTATETLALNRPEWPIVCSDISQVDFEEYQADVVTGGFPCQAFSYAGHRLGFEDTRGTLFFEVERILQYHKPKVILLENVKQLVTHDKGRTFDVIINRLTSHGYHLKWKVLNALDFGLPQKRERIIIVGFLDELTSYYFNFDFKRVIR